MCPGSSRVFLPVPDLGHRKEATLVLVYRSIAKWGLVHGWHGAGAARAAPGLGPRGQPCLCCWLVSPLRWMEASLPVAVPVFGPALGCFCAFARGVMSFGGVAT